MQVRDLFGKTITDIYRVYEIDVNELDTSECFIELDKKLYISFPFSSGSTNFVIDVLDPNAGSIFAGMKNFYPVYLSNKENKTFAEIIANQRKRQQKPIAQLLNYLFGYVPAIKEYEPYAVAYRENELKHIRHRKITGYIEYSDDTEKGFLVLDNGYLISETNVAPHGIGAGLFWFGNVDALIEQRGKDFIQLP